MTDLDTLYAKMTESRVCTVSDFNWREPVRLPLWMSREHAANFVRELIDGERATARACMDIAPRIADHTARAIIGQQALDEERHAVIFERYLARLGRAPAGQSSAAAMHAEIASWAGPPVAKMLACLIVFEGEFIQLQGALRRLVPCPLFAEINCAVAQKEARHIAFSTLYLRDTLPSLSYAERRDIFVWLRRLWRSHAKMTVDALPVFIHLGLPGGLDRWLRTEWREREDMLEGISLFTAAERPAISAAS